MNWPTWRGEAIANQANESHRGSRIARRKGHRATTGQSLGRASGPNERVADGGLDRERHIVGWHEANVAARTRYNGAGALFDGPYITARGSIGGRRGGTCQTNHYRCAFDCIQLARFRRKDNFRIDSDGYSVNVAGSLRIGRSLGDNVGAGCCRSELKARSYCGTNDLTRWRTDLPFMLQVGCIEWTWVKRGFAILAVRLCR